MDENNNNSSCLNNNEINPKLSIVNDEKTISSLLKNIIIQDDFQSILEEYSCGICFEIIYKKEPLQCKEGHFACKNCFEKHLSRMNECMVCRLQIKSIDELGRVRFIEESLSKKKIKCPYSYYISIFNQNISSMDQSNFESTYKDINGCGKIIMIKELESHLNNCNLRFIKCPNNNNGCEEVIRFKSLNDHINHCIHTNINCSFCHIQLQRHQLESHFEICPLVKIQCHQCSHHIKRGEINKHIESDCSDTIIQCDYFEYGCTVQLKRRDYKCHYENINHTKYMTKMIQQQSKQIVESNNQINQLNKIISHNDQQQKIFKDQMYNSITNINDTLSKLDEQLKESKNQINQLNEVVSQKDHQINQFKDHINDINNSITVINGSILKKEKELNQYKDQLSNINISFTKSNNCLSKIDRILNQSENNVNRIDARENSNNTIRLIWEISNFSNLDKRFLCSNTIKCGDTEFCLEFRNFEYLFLEGENKIVLNSEKNNNFNCVKLKVLNLLNPYYSLKTNYKDIGVLNGNTFNAFFNINQQLTKENGFISQDDKLTIYLKLFSTLKTASSYCQTNK